MTVNLDRLESGASTWVTIDALVNSNFAPDASIVNRALVLYRESVAVQAAVEINLGAGETSASPPAEPTVQPTAAASEPEAQADGCRDK